MTAFVISAALFGLGFGAVYPSFMTWVLDRTDEKRRAATFGSVLFAFDIGIGIGTGSIVTGIMIERFSYTAAFEFAALLKRHRDSRLPSHVESVRLETIRGEHLGTLERRWRSP